MSAQNWTKAQRDAIELRGGSILVGAAAGSGKTSVLVERIVRLLTDEAAPVDADRLLVVTFTNAAAAEMSSRIKRELIRRLREAPQDRQLRRQLLLLRRAQICTIDAFCGSLVREYWNRLGISPDFSAGSEALIGELRERAMQELLDRLYADEQSGVQALADLFGRSRSDKATAELLQRLCGFEETLAFPEVWENACLQDLGSAAPIEKSRAGAYLLEYAQGALAYARSLCTEALDLAAEDEVLRANYEDALRCDLGEINDLAAQAAAGSWDACVARAADCCHAPLGRKHGADAALRTAAAALRSEYKNVLEKLHKNCFCLTSQQFADDEALLREPIRTLFSIRRLYTDRVFELEKERRTFDFSTLEHLALSLVCGPDRQPTPLAQELSARWDHILIDEYQDSNETQDLLFRSLSRGEQNLFCVGDVKQSIYSFRNADPGIFLGHRAQSHPLAQGLFPAYLQLSENFRSSRPVIAAVNAVFSPLMTAAVGGVDYGEGEALTPCEGAGAPDPVGLDVQLLAHDDEEDEAPAVRHAAALISRLLREGYPIQGRDGLRPCRPADFCILLRAANRSAGAYKQALEAAGVRAWTDGADSLFDNSEIAVLVSLLAALDNPRRDLDLAAVLLSPLFGFTTDDLARLKLRGRRTPLYSLLLTDDAPQSRAFLASFAQLRAKQSLLGADELLRFAVDSLDAELLLCAGPDMARRRGNIRLFLDLASQFAAATDGSLPMFLRVCARAKESGKAASRAFAPPEDAVCITSIHKSKGLEWPVVLLGNTGSKFNTRDTCDPSMLFDARLGLGARVRIAHEDGAAMYAHKTAAYAMLSLRAGERTLSEEMRVLYVALTRARQKLFVFAELAKPPETVASLSLLCGRSARPDPFLVASRGNFISWILLALLSGNTSAQRALCEHGRWDGGAVSISLPAAETEDAAAPAPAALPAADPAAVAALNERLAFCAPRLALREIPVKLSVTKLTKEGSLSAVPRPAFARGALTAAQKGTAIHLFMQCANYASAQRSVSAELQRLVDQEFISARDAAEIDVRRLEALFASDFGRYIASAPRVLREYAFIDAVPAARLAALPGPLADEQVLIQGIADCIVLEADHAVLIDYKSDRVTEPGQLISRYSGQLALYKAALDKRLEVPVTRSFLYSFALGRAVEIAL